MTVGQTIWALATSVGAVALPVASAPLFLAVNALRQAFRPSSDARDAARLHFWMAAANDGAAIEEKADALAA